MCIRDRYQRRVRGSARPVAMGCTTSKDPPESLHKMAKELYHLIDKDSDKKLTIDEIVAWLSNNKKHASDTDMDAFAKEIYAIAKEMDRNEDNTVSEEEFNNYFSRCWEKNGEDNTWLNIWITETERQTQAEAPPAAAGEDDVADPASK
eukprot:TRINITY_DN38_c0_g1_i2.p1 TRINITY_DN38_c0_g1~~TRINITY_DN38_c0_g1_i2.p1  ORF type:complete len:149 (+),score=60.34 TRINITY_DN38_c0_g1_i2:143-589(+)